MIDYVSKQDKMLRSREGTTRLSRFHLFHNDLKYNILNKQ